MSGGEVLMALASGGANWETCVQVLHLRCARAGVSYHHLTPSPSPLHQTPTPTPTNPKSAGANSILTTLQTHSVPTPGASFITRK